MLKVVSKTTKIAVEKETEDFKMTAECEVSETEVYKANVTIVKKSNQDYLGSISYNAGNTSFSFQSANYNPQVLVEGMKLIAEMQPGAEED